jgi:5-methyltetrahydropteroyltriglutamate--homocysteine methyltransferase
VPAATPSTSIHRVAGPSFGRIVAYQHGIYPRSEGVVQATRDVERGRTTPDQVDQAFDADRLAFVDLQRSVGLDLVSNGLLRWQDLFRPLVEGSDGLDARVLVRWFDNNSFYRAPELRGSPRLTGLAEWVTADGMAEPRVATLPSPFLFSRVALPEGDADRLMDRLTGDVLAPAVTALAEAGHRLIHLEEPWLAFSGIEDGSWDALERALGTIRGAAGDCAVVLHVYYGDAGPHANRLVRLPVDAIGVDFAETDLDQLPSPWPIGLVAGAIDGRRSVIEPADEVASFARRVLDRLGPPTLFLSSGSDLELLGPEVARRKVEVLGEAARRLREAA